MKQLIIVESPHKATTIQNYLGQSYKVVASKGHVCDLPQKTLGIDMEHDFEPQYIISPEKQKTIDYLVKEVKKYDRVYLATDPDREGEAISWHLDSKTTKSALSSTKFQRMQCSKQWKTPVKSTTTLSTVNKQDASLTALWATRFHLSFQEESKVAHQQAECNQQPSK